MKLGTDEEEIYCKDCRIWKRSNLTIKVENSELRFCKAENKLKFGYDYQCQKVVSADNHNLE